MWALVSQVISNNTWLIKQQNGKRQKRHPTPLQILGVHDECRWIRHIESGLISPVSAVDFVKCTVGKRRPASPVREVSINGACPQRQLLLSLPLWCFNAKHVLLTLALIPALSVSRSRVFSDAPMLGSPSLFICETGLKRSAFACFGATVYVYLLTVNVVFISQRNFSSHRLYMLWFWPFCELCNITMSLWLSQS